MNLQTILHADAFENEKDFLKSEIEKNISGKLDAYIRPRLSENNDSVRIEAFFDRSKTGFDGKLILSRFPTQLCALHAKIFQNWTIWYLTFSLISKHNY